MAKGFWAVLGFQISSTIWVNSCSNELKHPPAPRHLWRQRAGEEGRRSMLLSWLCGCKVMLHWNALYVLVPNSIIIARKVIYILPTESYEKPCVLGFASYKLNLNPAKIVRECCDSFASTEKDVLSKGNERCKWQADRSGRQKIRAWTSKLSGQP